MNDLNWLVILASEDAVPKTQGRPSLYERYLTVIDPCSSPIIYMLDRINRQSHMGVTYLIGPRKAPHSFSLVTKAIIHSETLIIV